MEHIMGAFIDIFTPGVFFTLLFGVCIGLLVGALLGLNDTITLAVIVPHVTADRFPPFF